MLNLMRMKIFHGHRFFLSGFLGFKVNIMALVDTRIVCCGSLQKVSLYNFGSDTVRLINLDNLNGGRLFMDDSESST